MANDGTLAFNRSDVVTFGGVVSGSGVIRQIGSGLTKLTGDSSGFAGTTSVEDGTLAVNGSLCGDVNVRSGGRLQGTGTVCDTNNFAGGTVAPGNCGIGTLTVAGNYVGNGGTLEIETVLGGDASPTDRLVVTGNTSGTTEVRVINLGGGGAQTVEGIKVVDVGGTSDGTFTPARRLCLPGRAGRGRRRLCLPALQERRQHAGRRRLVSALGPQSTAIPIRSRSIRPACRSMRPMPACCRASTNSARCSSASATARGAKARRRKAADLPGQGAGRRQGDLGAHRGRPCRARARRRPRPATTMT